jgi:hypothetical protein
MRALHRNKIRIFYANYRDKIHLKDEYGNLTGEYEISYTNPIAVCANVSAARGESTTRQFGEDVNYDRIIVLDDPAFPITETSILWIDALPDIAEDGTTKTLADLQFFVLDDNNKLRPKEEELTFNINKEFVSECFDKD